MKLIKVLLIMFVLYISAYSKDILNYHAVLEDRNLNINIDDVKLSINNKINFNDDDKLLLDNGINNVKKLISDGKFFEAIESLNNLESSYSNYYDIYYLRGLSYFKRGDLSYAFSNFNKLLSLYIDKDRQDEIYKFIGDFFDTINEYEQTLKTYIIAYKQTNDPYWLFLAGNVSLKNFDTKSANYFFNICLKENSRYGREGLGDLALINNNYDEALNNYSMIKKKYISEDDIIIINNKVSNAMIQKELYDWNNFLISGDYTNAFIVLENISSYSAQYPEITAAFGKTYFKIGDYKNAESILSKLISSEKDFDEAYAILAQIYAYENNYSEAIKILEKGFEYSYYKPILYETFASILYNAGYSYYPNKIISQILNFYNISDENKINYSKYLISQKEYDKASELLKTVKLYSDIVNELLNSIEYNKILDNAELLKNKNRNVALMQLLSLQKFKGYEEQIRIGYIANTYNELGSIDKAIDILQEAFNANIISINNVLLLRKLLEIRSSNKDTSAFQKERDIIDIKAAEYWEEELKLNLHLVTDRINEFIKYNQYNEALAYISDLRNKDYPIDYIKNVESSTYGLYAAYLYNNGEYEDADKTAALAVKRNRDNYDAIAIKKEMDIDSYLSSIGHYDNINVYVKLSSTMKEVVRISPAYIENRIKLSEALIIENNIEGFDIINNIVKYIDINGGRDLILGREYANASLYEYSLEHYNRASKYLKVDPVYIAETIINLDNYNISSSELSKMVNDNLKYADGLYAASKLYTKIEDYEEAVNVINNALALDINNMNYMYQKAYINENIGKVKNALSEYEHIIKMNKNYAAANYRLALIYLNNFKDYNEAEVYALNYLALTPDDYSGYELLANIYKTKAESYIDDNYHPLLKESLNNFRAALSKAVWGKDENTRLRISNEINYIQNKMLE